MKKTVKESESETIIGESTGGIKVGVERRLKGTVLIFDRKDFKSYLVQYGNDFRKIESPGLCFRNYLIGHRGYWTGDGWLIQNKER